MANRLNNLVGLQFGLLLVLERVENCSQGKPKWLCRCDCGNQKIVQSSNLVSGNVRSCGCLRRELSSARRKAAKRQPTKCKVEDCCNTAEQLEGLCGKHAQRVRRYGSVDYLTPEDQRRANNREAQLARFPEVKSTTYRKLFGRHEHRVIGEKIAGRALLPREHVHHKDENKQNNHPDNLQIMSAEEHIRYHAIKRGRSDA